MAASSSSRGPLQLIQIDDSGKCHLQGNAVSVLSQLGGRVAVVGIAGLYRSGKSFLLNRLLGQQRGFEIGPTVNPCTKGIWIWGEPVRLAPDYHCIFLDTEGLGSTQRTSSCDMQILSLCVLLSSCFIYNSMGAIDEQALDELHLVANLARHIHARSKDGGGGAEARLSELSRYFPSFFWVLRDFHLQLLGEAGGTITAKDYLENTLKPLPGREDHNKVRSTLKDLFRQRDCVALVRPAADEQDLRSMDQLPYDSLRPQFREGVEDLVKRVYAGLQPKAIEGTPLTGAMLVSLMSEYCNAINNSAVPIIHSAWSSVIQMQLRSSLKQALQVYRSHLEERVLPKVPMNEDHLHGIHKAAKAEALKHFLVPGFEESDPRVRDYRSELTRRVKQQYEDLKCRNANESNRQCEKVAAELYDDHIESRLRNHGSYQNIGQLMEDWDQVQATYNQKTAGLAQGEVRSTWLVQRMAESVRRLSQDLQSAADQRHSTLQQMLSKAEERGKVCTSLEKCCSMLLTERDIVQTLTDEARRYREAMASRRACLNSICALERDRMACQWRLDALDVHLRATEGHAPPPELGVAPAVREEEVVADEEATRRRNALEQILSEIDVQRAVAIASLEERASASSASSASSSSLRRAARPRGAAGDAERTPPASEVDAAVRSLQDLARSTYQQIGIETRQILDAASDAEGLKRLRDTFECHQEFWGTKLAEAQASQREAKERMNHTSGEATEAWAEVAAAMEGVIRCWQAAKPTTQRPALLQALAVATARGLEAELLDPLGLTPGGGAVDTHTETDDEFQPDARRSCLVSVLELLRGAEALPRVGEALMQEVGATIRARARAISTDEGEVDGGLLALLPASAAALVSRGTLADAEVLEDWEANSATDPLLFWLMEVLVEATCDLALRGDLRRLRGILEFCSALGGTSLGREVPGAASQARSRQGRTPLQLAFGAGHDKAVRLLRDWPDDSESAVQSVSCMCMGLSNYSKLNEAAPAAGSQQGGGGGGMRRMLMGALESTMRWKGA